MSQVLILFFFFSFSLALQFAFQLGKVVGYSELEYLHCESEAWSCGGQNRLFSV